MGQQWPDETQASVCVVQTVQSRAYILTVKSCCKGPLSVSTGLLDGGELRTTVCFIVAFGLLEHLTQCKVQKFSGAAGPRVWQKGEVSYVYWAPLFPFSLAMPGGTAEGRRSQPCAGDSSGIGGPGQEEKTRNGDSMGLSAAVVSKQKP